MSAMPAEKLREPEKLYSPPEHFKDAVEKLIDELPPDMARQLVRQFLAAVDRSRTQEDLRPLDDIVQSWFRSLMFMSRPRFEALWVEAQGTDGPRLTLEDIRERRARRRTL